jgi:hypothetical protein
MEIYIMIDQKLAVLSEFDLTADKMTYSSEAMPLVHTTSTLTAVPAAIAVTVHYAFVGNNNKQNLTEYRSYNPWQQMTNLLEAFKNAKKHSVIDWIKVDDSVYTILFDPSAAGLVHRYGGYSHVVTLIMNDFTVLFSPNWCQGDRIDIIFPGIAGMECRLSMT